MKYKIKINLNLYSQTFSLYTKYTNIYKHLFTSSIFSSSVGYCGLSGILGFHLVV